MLMVDSVVPSSQMSGSARVLCTSVAFQVLRSTGALLDDALVSPSTDYLLKTMNREMGHWRIIPQSAQESPHAPWWDQADVKVFDRFSLNPTAEILGYLYDYQQLVPGDIISSVSDRVTGHLSGLDEIEMHDLLCCLRLLRTEALSENSREPIHQKLTHLVGATIACDPAEWEGYSLRPLQVVHDPERHSWPASKRPSGRIWIMRSHHRMRMVPGLQPGPGRGQIRGMGRGRDWNGPGSSRWRIS
jgi:hypothetical protein